MTVHLPPPPWVPHATAPNREHARGTDRPQKTRRSAAGVVAVSMLAAALGLSGCAALGPQTPEQQVSQRAQARWDALSQRQFSAAYALLAPSLRQLITEDRWARRFGGAATWKSAEIINVQCEEQRCEATVRINAYVMAGPRQQPEITTHIQETWVREEGRWWYFQKL